MVSLAFRALELRRQLLLRGVVWKVSLVWLTGLFLCCGILSFSHVLQPSADVKFGSVFSGETESRGHVSACSELESVALGGFVHTHSETFSVKGPHLFIGLFSYPSVAGANTLGLGLPCVFGPLGDWWIFVARVHLCRIRALSSSLLLMYVEEGRFPGVLFDNGEGLRDVFAPLVGRLGRCYRWYLGTSCRVCPGRDLCCAVGSGIGPRRAGTHVFKELGPSAHWNGEFFASHRQF